MMRRAAPIALAVCALAALVWLSAALDRQLASGFALRLTPGASGAPARDVRVYDLDPVRAHRLAPAHPAHARWSGWLDVEEAGAYDLVVAARSPTDVAIGDGAAVLAHDGRPRRLVANVTLPRGLQRVVVVHDLGDDEADLRVALARRGAEPARLDALDVFVDTPSPARRLFHRLGGASAWIALVGLVAAAGLAFDRVRRLSPETRARLTRRAVHAAAILLTAYGALLRLEALASKYDAPGWMGRTVPIARALHPRGMKWVPPERPYDGDPFSYLQLAREMTSFYGASVREPLFVLTTKVGLAVTGDRPVAVNLASALFSILLIAATYLLGVTAFSPGVGLAAAAAVAVERQLIGLGVDGWRDDAFAFFVVSSAAALLRLHERPTRRTAVLAGLVMAGALLTRITSLSLLVPGLLLVVASGPTPRRDRLRQAGLAAALAAVLVLPFLVSCWRAYGDPLYSINAHTRFYRSRVAGAHEAATTWLSFLGEGRGPFALVDTAVVGLTSYPFANKWEHFDYWAGGLGPLLAAAALLGLAAWTTFSRGRLLLTLLVASLLPYAFTWDIPGGSEWRFTLHAYPFYLLAAASAPGLIVGAARRLRQTDRPRRIATVAAGLAASAVVLYIGLCALAYGRAGEEIAAGRPATIAAGPRDLFFFGRGWSRLRSAGHQWIRRARDEATLRLPLKAGQGYRLHLRLDPEGDGPAAVDVALNEAALGALPLQRDALRFGSYTLDVAPGLTRDGTNILRLRANAGVRLWLVRVEPISGPAASPR